MCNCQLVIVRNFRVKIEEFLSLIQNSQNSPEYHQLAFNILAARKFSVPQAMELYHNYQTFLASEQITRVDPFEEDVRRELLSGKFVILNDNDIPGVRVAQFFVRLHRKSGNHRALLHSIIFQLDAALRRETAARNGLVFIFDMTDSKYSNFDYTFSCKLFKMLRSSYPVRLRRVLILTAPLWFRAPFLLMRVFIRELFQDCVYVLRPSPGTKLEALSHPDPVILKRDHYAWLQTALLRTGWLLTEAEQLHLILGNIITEVAKRNTYTDIFIPSLPIDHRNQTVGAFFGPPSESTGSLSDSSDSEFREDDDCFSNNQLDDVTVDDDLISVGDLDPFSLTSSYSGEAESSDLEECTSDVIMKTFSSSNLEKMNDSNYNPKSVSNYSEACSYDHKRQTLSNSEHGGTPTPPTVAKRPQLSNLADLNYSTGVSDHTNSRSSNAITSGNHVMGFNEDVSLMRIDPVTPTADNSIKSPLISEAFGTKQTAFNSANSHELNSSCSSNTSFLSTGFTGVHSTKCNPLSDKLLNQLITSSLPKTTEFERRGISKVIHEVSGLTTSNDHDLPLADAEISDSICLAPVQNKIAPLAQDEIEDRTICNNKNPIHMLPRISDVIPNWAVGRPQGDSIHQDHNLIYPVELSSSSMNNSQTTEITPLNSSLSYLVTSGYDKCNEWDVETHSSSSSSSLHRTTNNTTVSIDSAINNNHNTCSDNHRDALLSSSIERQKIYDEIDANMIEINSTTSSSDDVSARNDEGVIDVVVNDDDFEPEEEIEEDNDDDEQEDEDDDDNLEVTQTIIMQEHWMNPNELVQHIENVGLTGLNSEYSALVQLKNEYTHIAFKHILNRSKNRYCDVICHDATRVYLQPLLLSSDISRISTSRSDEDPTVLCNAQKSLTARLHRTHSAPISAHTLVKNYIHANWVDGYRQKNAFICTQGPLSETVGDFWQMIWDYHCPIIVMITRILEAQRSKCYLYWPDVENQKLYFSSSHTGCLYAPTSSDRSNNSFSKFSSSNNNVTPDFLIENVKCESNGNFAQTTLRITHLQLHEVRTVEHFAFFSWPDHGTPQTTEGLLDLLTSVQLTYLNEIEKLGYKSYEDQKTPPPPVVVHCSAGIGRTGTYVTVDICTKWLADSRNTEHKINIPLTVARVRSQRFGCVQVSSQYVFCYRAIIDFAVNSGLLDSNKAQQALDLLCTESDAQTSSSSSVLPNSSFYQSTSLPRPFPGLITNYINDVASTLSSSSTFRRSPFHELLALFSPASLASIKNSIRFKKYKDDLNSSDFSTMNGVLGMNETCFLDVTSDNNNQNTNALNSIALTTNFTGNNTTTTIPDNSSNTLGNGRNNNDNNRSESFIPPFTRPMKPAIFSDDKSNQTANNMDKSKSNSSMKKIHSATQSSDTGNS
ncbi:protein-tyrosine phosphatase n9, putative [Schistosoma mansoni]|uniref:protein-tyrosine phosphatase n9, putative n=1 Tax=Schistosoma mansoni TaxID=6183 RepID=UPI00022C825E|nr:protein-tyrosine phosphatase n9, putative [Schistosoma mansoni]|eukprot:XP_018645998.1 protein-tyrosine phosphatase n9, putative [Schistosoma mansoni]